jgi:hypothetical protein
MENEVEFNPATMTRATQADIQNMWMRLWGFATVLYLMRQFDTESGEYLDLTQTKSEVIHEGRTAANPRSSLSNLPVIKGNETV